MVATILWFAFVRRRSSRGVSGFCADIWECGAALDDMANEANAIGAVTIKARQFSKRILARDL